LPSMIYSEHALSSPKTSVRSLRSSFDRRLPNNAAVAAWIDERTGSDEPVYALYADAALYYVADRPSPFKYLWERGVERIPGAMGELAGLLQGPDAPRYVIQYALPTRIQGGEMIKRVLDRHYHRVANVDGTTILLRNGSAMGPPKPHRLSH
jgi:hypothetical protein